MKALLMCNTHHIRKYVMMGDLYKINVVIKVKSCVCFYNVRIAMFKL